jgi:hypoxanthine phosphoribosyltransferase
VARRGEPDPSKPSNAGGTSKKSSKQQPLKSDSTDFAHASERQFARLLDFYQIEWEYEPKSFDLERDSEGNVVQRFTPDFYLPAYDLFIEITTLNQKLVTKKNRKIRRLRELYPEVSCKIFYQRDYLSLVRKYGLEDMAG